MRPHRDGDARAGGAARWFRGSVAEDIIRDALCPVLIVKTIPARNQERRGQAAGKDAG